MLTSNVLVALNGNGRACAGVNRNNFAADPKNIYTVGVMTKSSTFESEPDSEWNPSNFDAVIESFQPRIFRFIYAIVGETETANDLTQDTFFNAYRNLCRRYEESEQKKEPLQRPSDNMSAWLYTIARNTAFSEMRRRKVVRFFSFWQHPKNGDKDIEYDGMLDFKMTEPGGSLENRSVLSDEVNQAIDKVGREKVNALLLHIDGFSYKEICEITGDSLSSVKSQIFRAKESLRKVMAVQEKAEQPSSKNGGGL